MKAIDKGIKAIFERTYEALEKETRIARNEIKELDLELLRAFVLHLIPPMTLPNDWETLSPAALQTTLSKATDRRLMLDYPDALSPFDVVVLEAVKRAGVIHDALHGQIIIKIQNPTAAEMVERFKLRLPEEQVALDAAVRKYGTELGLKTYPRLKKLFWKNVENDREMCISEILKKLLPKRRPATRWAYYIEFIREKTLRSCGEYFKTKHERRIDAALLPKGSVAWVLNEADMPFRVVESDKATESDKKDSAININPPRCILMEEPDDAIIPAGALMQFAYELDYFFKLPGIAELVERKQKAAGGISTAKTQQRKARTRVNEERKHASKGYMKLSRQDSAALNRSSRAKKK